MTKVYIGTDHNGFALKEEIKRFLFSKGYTVEDLGNKKLDKKDDYPDFAKKVARQVAKGKNAKGILFCGSGQGMAIVANKIKGVRAVFVNDIKEAELTRAHNDSNVLCISGWKTSLHKAQKMIYIWLNTPFSLDKRHKRRVDKIKRLDKK